MLVFLGRISINLADSFFFSLCKSQVSPLVVLLLLVKKGLFTGSLSKHLDSEILYESVKSEDPKFPSDSASLGSFLILLKLIIKKNPLYGLPTNTIFTLLGKNRILGGPLSLVS